MFVMKIYETDIKSKKICEKKFKSFAEMANFLDGGLQDEPHNEYKNKLIYVHALPISFSNIRKVEFDIHGVYVEGRGQI